MIEAAWAGRQVEATDPIRGRIVGFGAVTGSEEAEENLDSAN